VPRVEYDALQAAWLFATETVANVRLFTLNVTVPVTAPPVALTMVAVYVTSSPTAAGFTDAANDVVVVAPTCSTRDPVLVWLLTSPKIHGGHMMGPRYSVDYCIRRRSAPGTQIQSSHLGIVIAQSHFAGHRTAILTRHDCRVNDLLVWCGLRVGRR
jgi:hypothetical protein